MKKYNFVWIIALILSLLTCLPGCDLARSAGLLPAETLPQAIEGRPRNEIQQEGITAEDVLAVYDQLAAITTKYLYSDIKDTMGDVYNNMDARFVSITAPLEYKIPDGYSEDGIPLSFYPLIDEHLSPAHWLEDDRMYNVYPITFHADVLYGRNVLDHKYEFLVWNDADFDLIAQAFGSTSFIVTEDTIEQEPNKTGAYLYSDISYVGKPAYPAFTITREVIENANEEQLWALYNAATNGFLTTNFVTKEKAYAILDDKYVKD